MRRRRDVPARAEARLLVLASRIAPEALMRELLVREGLVGVGRVDAGHRGHGHDVVEARPRGTVVVCLGAFRLERAGDAAVHAKDLVVDGGGEGEAVEHLVAGLPDSATDRVAEAAAALVPERAVSVVGLPPVHVAGLVVPAEEENLPRERQLEGQQVRRHLERVEPAVHVVAQKQKTPGRQVDSELPDVVGKKVQVFDVPVKVAKHVAPGGRGVSGRSGFCFSALPV